MKVYSLQFTVYRIIFILFTVYCLLFTVCFSQEDFVYDSKGRRDPFISLVTSEGNIIEIEPEEQLPGINLEGIIYDEKGLSYAIINKMMVRAGDIISDYKIYRIESDRILLLKDTETIELKLKKEVE